MWDVGHRGQPRPEPSPPAWLLAGTVLLALLAVPVLAFSALVVMAGELTQSAPNAYGTCESAAAADRSLVEREVFGTLPAHSVRDPQWRSSFDADCEFGATEVSATWDRTKGPAVAKVLQTAGWQRTEPDGPDLALTKSFAGREVRLALGREGLRVYVPRGTLE